MAEFIGYMHPGYAESLAEFGKPRLLPKSGGWILERQIPGFPSRDSMGCYPLFSCQDWSYLYSDLEDITKELVSLAVVTDPFGAYDLPYLQRCFRDMVIPFKKHFVVDLSREMSTFVSGHHRRSARKALQHVYVQRCEQPTQFINEWVDLYANLIKRHHIRGMPTFSRSSFIKQLEVPGLVMFRGVHQGTTVGIILCFIQGNVGYYHLGAYSEIGYELKVSFALFWHMIDYLAANRLRWLNLGAGAGVAGNYADGLTLFKQGWSTGTVTAYFCGRIFDSERYAEIVKAMGIAATDYFPAYRKGEFW